MGRPHGVAALLKAGRRPRIVAAELGISTSSVSEYAKTAIGKGMLRKVDVLTSIPREARDAMDVIIANEGIAADYEITQRLKKVGVALDSVEVRLYLDLRDGTMADMYELVRKIEIRLHGLIRTTMIDTYGDRWWRDGIPQSIRCECASSQEADGEPASEPYCYTTFIQLKEIFEKKWAILSEQLPLSIRKRKPEFTSCLAEVNRIRNAVMHPVKNLPINDEKFAMVNALWAELNTDASRTKG